METSTSWEAGSRLARHIPRLLWNSKARYRVYKSLLPVPILCKMNPLLFLQDAF